MLNTYWRRALFICMYRMLRLTVAVVVVYIDVLVLAEKCKVHRYLRWTCSHRIHECSCNLVIVYCFFLTTQHAIFFASKVISIHFHTAKVHDCNSTFCEVHTYFGCGGNTTCLHADPSENLLLVVMGEKFLDIYPPCDAACNSVPKVSNGNFPWELNLQTAFHVIKVWPIPGRIRIQCHGFFYSFWVICSIRSKKFMHWVGNITTPPSLVIISDSFKMCFQLSSQLPWIVWYLDITPRSSPLRFTSSRSKTPFRHSARYAYHGEEISKFLGASLCGSKSCAEGCWQKLVKL